MIGSWRRSRPARWSLLVLGLAWTGASGAGRNEGGSLIVHTDDAVSYTFNVCDLFPDLGLASCAETNTRTDHDESTPSLIWLIAAWHSTVSPLVTQVGFGLEHDLGIGEGGFDHWGLCHPGTYQFPEAGWPESGGNVVVFEPAVTDTFFAFYFVEAYGNVGNHLGIGVHPAAGRAYVLDDGSPALEDVIEQFGIVRWGAEGENACPGPIPTGQCCLPDATCSMIIERDCARVGGLYVGDGTTCATPCGACCYCFDGHYERRCVVTTQQDCYDDARWDSLECETEYGPLGAIWANSGEVCIDDPEWLILCFIPQAVLSKSWGNLKTLFR